MIADNDEMGGYRAWAAGHPIYDHRERLHQSDHHDSIAERRREAWEAEIEAIAVDLNCQIDGELQDASDGTADQPPVVDWTIRLRGVRGENISERLLAALAEQCGRIVGGPGCYVGQFQDGGTVLAVRVEVSTVPAKGSV